DQCGGGYTIDGVTHLVSEILWVTEQRAKRVTCIMDRLPSDRRSGLVLELESGALVTISALGDSDSGNRRVRNTFGGSKGMITVEGFDFLTTIQGEGEEESFREA